MNIFTSHLETVGILEFPEFSGIRVMMMPIQLENPENTTPDFLKNWLPAILHLMELAPCKEGVGYLTIDEKLVQAGQSQRRPGIHVDGIGPDGKVGGWGPGGDGGWGASGMLISSNYIGCRAWEQEFKGEPQPNGDCSNLAEQCRKDCIVYLQPNVVYMFAGDTVHEGIPLDRTVNRQFVRLSMPSDSPWYEGYTKNPTGVQPAGPIHPPRPVEFMAGIK